MLKNKEVQLQALPNITENAMYDLKNLEYALVWKAMYYLDGCNLLRSGGNNFRGRLSFWNIWYI